MSKELNTYVFEAYDWVNAQLPPPEPQEPQGFLREMFFGTKGGISDMFPSGWPEREITLRIQASSEESALAEAKKIAARQHYRLIEIHTNPNAWE